MTYLLLLLILLFPITADAVLLADEPFEGPEDAVTWNGTGYTVLPNFVSSTGGFHNNQENWKFNLEKETSGCHSGAGCIKLYEDGAEGGTAEFWSDIWASEPQEIWLSWWEKLSANYSIREGHKWWLVDLVDPGGPYISWQTWEPGGSNFASRWFHSGVIACANQTFGPSLGFNVPLNTWFQTKVHIKLNTPGVLNGTFEVWVNGTKRWDIQNTDTIRCATNQGFKAARFGGTRQRGSGTSSSGIKWIDDIKIATTEGEIEGGADTFAPIVTNPQPTGNLAPGTTQSDISVDATDVTGVSACRYHATADEPYGTMSGALSFASGTTYEANVTGLSDGNAYMYYAKCIDTLGNSNASDTVISFSVNLAQPPSMTIDNSPPVKTVDPTPALKFTITDADGSTGTSYSLTWGGSCSGPATVVGTGLKQVSLASLSSGSYSNCTLKVTDPEANESSVENIGSFEIITAETFFGQNLTSSDVQEGAPGSELGLYFKPTTNGSLLGVRLWRITGSVEAPHTVQLWDPSGTPTSLASAVSADEPFDGQWVDVFFTTPVALTSGTPYVVSFFSSLAQYGIQASAFTSPITSGNIYAYGNPESEGGLNVANGSFNDGGTAFPGTHSFGKNGFGVDVIFQAGGDTTPPVISNCGPSGAQAWDVGSVSLVCTTDEAATCKYGTPKGTAYASIANTFSTTGGTSHSQSLAAVEGRVYHRYVRCEDAAGNSNTTDEGVHWTVNTRAFGRVIH